MTTTTEFTGAEALQARIDAPGTVRNAPGYPVIGAARSEAPRSLLAPRTDQESGVQGDRIRVRLPDQWSVSVGSIPGREHVRLHRNNQDAACVRFNEDCLVAAVADGCGSSRFSEVGAQLGVQWLARHSATAWPGSTGHMDYISWSADGLTAFLAAIAHGLATDEQDQVRVVDELLLFSFMAAVITADRYVVFGLGDGVWARNGHVSVLDAGPGNAPDYLSYRLVPHALGVAAQRSRFIPRVYDIGATETLHSLILATDGAIELCERAAEPMADGLPQGGLAQFTTDERYLKNPSLLTKRLAVIGEGHRRLHDDTTLVVLRRKTKS